MLCGSFNSQATIMTVLQVRREYLQFGQAKKLIQVIGNSHGVFRIFDKLGYFGLSQGRYIQYFDDTTLLKCNYSTCNNVSPASSAAFHHTSNTSGVWRLTPWRGNMYIFKMAAVPYQPGVDTLHIGMPSNLKFHWGSNGILSSYQSVAATLWPCLMQRHPPEADALQA